MTLHFRFAPVLAGLLCLAGLGCEETALVGDEPAAPENLTYRLEPSGDPDRPSGIVLSWDDVSDSDLEAYHVYSRGGTSGSFALRGLTTSITFHDNGIPQAQYYVTAVDVDGNESSESNVVTIDERLRLERPTTLRSISLNRAVHLTWDDNAFAADPTRFALYRIYSSGYDLDDGLCDDAWSLEGTTVAPAFLVAAMANGVPRCFGVSAESLDGYESVWSNLWQDTPRFDARNTLVWAFDETPLASGFRFWQDLNGDGTVQDAELGLVVDGARTDIDFWMYRDPADSSLWIVPESSPNHATRVQLYDADDPVADLTSIDFAPATGYTTMAIEAVPGYAYVFEIVRNSTLRYGALRATHVGRDYVIFDWSFQSDLGNPELVVRGGLQTVTSGGAAVAESR
jgi:hypothetical protein